MDGGWHASVLRVIRRVKPLSHAGAPSAAAPGSPSLIRETASDAATQVRCGLLQAAAAAAAAPDSADKSPLRSEIF